MISWVLSQATMITAISLVLYLTRTLLLKRVGADINYQLWGLIPLSLLASTLPSVNQQVVGIYQHIVTVKQATDALSITWLDQQHLIVLGWLTGSVAILITIVIQHRQYFKILASSPKKQHGELTAFIDERLPERVSVWQSEQVTSPFISGLLKPKLILPTTFSQQFNVEQQRLILEHEIVHFKRGDLYWNVIAQTILLLFWFNPVSWLAYRHYRLSQELACDQKVVSRLQKPMRLAYANAMLKASSHNTKMIITSINYGEKELMQERLVNLKQH